MNVLIAGCGDLGCELGRHLIKDGMAVTGLRRSLEPLPYGIKTIQADVTQAGTLQTLNTNSPEFLVYSVAAHEATDQSYKAHYVDGLHNVLGAIDKSRLRHVFFISSTRVYGQNTEDILDENMAAIPADFGGERLLQGESLLKQLSCPGTVLRLSGIYGPGRTRMIRLAIDAANWPVRNVWSNRIHRDDAARFIRFLIQRLDQHQAIEDCYIVTDHQPTPQYEVLLWLAEQLGHNTRHIAVPTVEGGKRLSNQRMLATGYTFAYPTYQQGYTGLMLSV